MESKHLEISNKQAPVNELSFIWSNQLYKWPCVDWYVEDISTHDIDYVELVSSFLTWGSIYFDHHSYVSEEEW